MLMNQGVLSGPAANSNAVARPQATPVQKVVIVNGSGDVLDLLDTAVRAGYYDVVLVESVEHAYSQIKRSQPDLVVLYLPMHDVHSFQVLSMLKLDASTRDIPVITYTVEFEAESEDLDDDISEGELAPVMPALRMN
jgi:CheY-like chemotaxis protein